MTEIKKTLHVEDEKTPFTQFEKYWSKYRKQTIYALAVIVLLVGGFFGYKYFVQGPNEKKATEAMFRAEEYFRMDSARLALQGDNINAGFLKIMSKYGGTKAANLAGFYAGCSYMKLGDYNNAIKYLKDFSTSASQVQARTFGLLGDAYSELNKKEDAVTAYKKAGTISEKDDLISPEYLFRAGYLYESMGKNKEAIEMYQLIKEKYPNSQRGFDIDRYLARLGAFQ
ncbi:MAG: tetratricopeptide repeat protein [Bacteroidetes bacterium]|nr:tetratricopeptide repeat protein [Bacteroidota bacterium]